MEKFNYDFQISAASEEDADQKMQALIVLAKKLNPNELEKLAHIVEHDPVKTALAKRYLGL